MAGNDNNEKDLNTVVLYDYGESLGCIKKINISETFDEPLLLAAGCFDPNTQIKLKNGSSKKIRDILIGEELYGGGKVYMKMEALTNNLYKVDDVYVAGTHTIYENGVWLKVQDSNRAEPVRGNYPIINIGTDEHILVTASGVIFSDYYVSDKYVELEDSLVDYINEEKSEDLMREKFQIAN